MKEKKLGCDYQGSEFGAYYLDSVCIEGYLWDADSGDATVDGWNYTFGGDLPCPKCNHAAWREQWAESYCNDAYERASEHEWPFRKPRFKRDLVWALWHQVRGAVTYYWERGLAWVW